MKLRKEPVKPKKLPNVGQFTLLYRKGMPLSWKQFMIDASYWYGTLDED